MSQDIIVLNPNDDHGPAFTALTDKQKKFVLAAMMLGGRNDAEAARMAGYDSTDKFKQIGHALAHNSKIILALREEADRRLKGGAALAVSNLMGIARDPMDKNFYKATIELLNRTGFNAITQHHISVEHRDMTDIEKDQRILALCKELGLGESETQKMLIGAEVIDAEFSETSGREGLEDLI